MKKIICILFAAFFALTTLSACGKDTDDDDAETKASTTAASTKADTETKASTTAASTKTDTETKVSTTAASTKADTIGKHHVEINIKDYGKISVELDGDNAPITVANFLDLAGKGFYNSLTFHRIIKNFMMQGGDPAGTGSGGSGKNIKGEFTNNGVDNPLKNTRGAIAMARSASYDSASSQFFIVQQDSPHLNGDYAVFGYVTAGMDIVDKICNETPAGKNGVVTAENQPVITSVKVID